jgi:hypothetical protein
MNDVEIMPDDSSTIDDDQFEIDIEKSTIQDIHNDFPESHKAVESIYFKGKIRTIILNQ